MAQTAKKSARDIAMERRRLSYESGKAGIQTMQGSSAKATAARSVAASNTRVAKSGSGMNARQASLARRHAMSSGGKASIASTDRTRGDEMGGTTAATTPISNTAPIPNKATTATSEARDCGCGCKGDKSKRPEMTTSPKSPVVQVGRGKKIENPTRSASLARRVALSSKGKAAISSKGPSVAQTTRASNPNISSRELAQTVREKRSTKGKCKTGSADSKCRPTGRMRPGKQTAGAAQEASWKVGASETSHGQTVTGTMVGRSDSVTGDEPSTCRAVTGTEYMGADIFRQFCQTDAAKTPRKIFVTSTATGNAVSGNELGRSAKVTGDEPGTCKRVTGVQYVGVGQMKEFCGTSSSEAGPSKITSAETRKGKTVTGNNVGRSKNVTGDEYGSNRELTGTSVMQNGNSGRAPAKVGKSGTLRGGNVTGTMVGGNENVTGDEPGSCRNVTGDDYIGKEQFGTFCKSTPKATDQKVGVSSTLKNKTVTGTMTGRDSKVTGDEPGTCKAVTGTPYAGAENYKDYCDTSSASMARARTHPRRETPGMPMTGLQPGIGGKMTGTGKGACEPLTGTPYVGADQFANACPSVPADTSSPDFPQPLGSTPWGRFSVEAPNHASQTNSEHSSVTGTQYEKGHITGPFGMAGGKVTGTEEARFGNDSYGKEINIPVQTYTAQLVDDRVKPRISGEGQDAGLRITGDDWDRNERVTGTEGLSTTRRNPTRRGGGSALAMQMVSKRNEELPVPNSKVTGSSGNTEKGSLITYSGGARG